jgi:hypothetical protein
MVNFQEHWYDSRYDDGRTWSAIERVAVLIARITRHRPGLLLLWRKEGRIGLASRDSGGVNSSMGKEASRMLASCSRMEARRARIASVGMKNVGVWTG